MMRSCILKGLKLGAKRKVVSAFLMRWVITNSQKHMSKVTLNCADSRVLVHGRLVSGQIPGSLSLVIPFGDGHILRMVLVS